MSSFALATYKDVSGPRAGLVLDGKLLDLEAVHRAAGRPLGKGAAAPMTVDALLAAWPEVERPLARLAARGAELLSTGRIQPVPRGGSRLLAPLTPRRIFCAAANYREHAQEMGSALAAKSQSKPYFFLKLPENVIAPGAAVMIPPESAQVDWEVELGVVIGRRGRRIPAARALDHVAGYTIVNDVSARDCNMRSDYPFKFDWFHGKCFETFAPVGPWLVPRSCIADPQKLRMRLAVNDEVMQDSDTGKMIFDVREQIEYLSCILTLEPGDLIATGTPTGVGMARGIFLKPGATMTAGIEGLGTLTTPVRAERVRDGAPRLNVRPRTV
ncbi:MAG TPA: fumarylacetoacetate hydrolase family protein [Methylomirabilota bacterium]|jgi:2-keto-4-pentenoate hydratase/2-oxohepta-3-ene-1,7-dioic acid hydratase in catechol pathway|nr:fumarylacetoacetate hydrolase family protein [Methylomirabilota bacterium]